MSQPNYHAQWIKYEVLIRLRLAKDNGIPLNYWTFLLSAPQGVALNLADLGTGVDSSFAGQYYPAISGAKLSDTGEEHPLCRVVFPRFSFDVARYTAAETPDVTRSITLIEAVNTCQRFYGHDVTVFLRAPGTTLDAGDMRFTGVLTEESMKVQRDTLNFNCITGLEIYDVDFPVKTWRQYLANYQGTNWETNLPGFTQFYGVAAPSQADPDILDEVAPIVYGRWTAPADDFALPAFAVGGLWCVNDYTNSTRWIQLQQSPFLMTRQNDGTPLGLPNGVIRITDGSDKVLKDNEDWHVIPGTANGPTIPPALISLPLFGAENAVDGGANAYDKAWKFYVQQTLGVTDAAGNVLENPVDVLSDLLFEKGGIPTSYRGASFVGAPLGSAPLSSYAIRGYLGKDHKGKLLTGLAQEICQDCGLLLRVINGVLEVFKNPLFQAVATSDVLAGAADATLNIYNTDENVSETANPSYFNQRQAVVFCAWNPSDKDFKTQFPAAPWAIYQSQEQLAAQATDTNILTLKSYWLWRAADVADAWSRLSALANSIIRKFEGEAPIAGLGMDLPNAAGRQNAFVWQGTNEAPVNYAITTIAPDLLAATARISALGMAGVAFGAADVGDDGSWGDGSVWG